MARAEISIYPFRESEAPPAHPQAALEEFRGTGLDMEITLFGLIATGQPDQLLGALQPALTAALAHGASKAILSIELQS